MQVLIMRHGDAIDVIANTAISRDSERPLSDRGRSESTLIARWLSRQVSNIEQVLVSPYLRTRQTLECLQKTLVLPDKHEVLLELIPDGNANLVCCYLQERAKKGLTQVLVVSHLPLVRYMVEGLCHNEQPPMFSTSSVASVYLDASSGQGKLCWHVGPQLLATV